MKILTTHIKKYEAITNRLSQIGVDVTINQIINHALANTIENADWRCLRKNNFKSKECPDGKYWIGIKDPQIESKLYNAITKYMVNGITKEDIVNFALAYSVATEVKLKKMYINATIDEYDIMDLLCRYSICSDSDDFEYRSKYDNFRLTFETHCPFCLRDHKAFWTIGNNVHVTCVSSKCGESSDLFGLLVELDQNIKDLQKAILFVWDFIINRKGRDLEFKKEQRTLRSKLEDDKFIIGLFDNVNLKNYFSKNDNSNNPLLKQGFKKEILDECHVYFRDDKLSLDNENSNKYRNRIIYQLFRPDGTLAGFKARRYVKDAVNAQDEDIRWQQFIDGDDFFDNYWRINTENLEKIWSQKQNTYIMPLKAKLYSKNNFRCKMYNMPGFKSSENLYLLNQYQDRITTIKKIVLVEGEKDALRGYQALRDEDVAVLATYTNNISEKQIELIKTYFKDDIEILIAYDNDLAGANGSLNAYYKLSRHFKTEQIKMVVFDKGKDFGEINDDNYIKEVTLYKEGTQYNDFIRISEEKYDANNLKYEKCFVDTSELESISDDEDDFFKDLFQIGA